MAFLAASQVWEKWGREMRERARKSIHKLEGSLCNGVGEWGGLSALLPSPLEQPQAREPGWKSTTRRGRG